MIKKAFWNLAVLGCNEHYFAHQVRESEDYIPELDFVMEEKSTGKRSNERCNLM